MRKYLVIYEEAVSHIWLCNRSLLDIWGKFCFLFYQAVIHIWHCNLSLLDFPIYEANFSFLISVLKKHLIFVFQHVTLIFSCLGGASSGGLPPRPQAGQHQTQPRLQIPGLQGSAGCRRGRLSQQRPTARQPAPTADRLRTQRRILRSGRPGLFREPRNVPLQPETSGSRQQRRTYRRGLRQRQQQGFWLVLRGRGLWTDRVRPRGGPSGRQRRTGHQPRGDSGQEDAGEPWAAGLHAAKVDWEVQQSRSGAQHRLQSPSSFSSSPGWTQYYFPKGTWEKTLVVTVSGKKFSFFGSFLPSRGWTCLKQPLDCLYTIAPRQFFLKVWIENNTTVGFF